MPTNFYEILTNIIGAVESGGQIYGNRRYDAYADPYTNTPNEHTITLGWAQNYGYEAKKLIQLIFDTDPEAFKSIDTDGSIQSMLRYDWVATRWKPSDKQKSILIKLISSDTGRQAQDALFISLMKNFIADCEKDYTTDPRAIVMYCEIRHLGGKKAAVRIFDRCKGNYDLDNILAALVADQKDTSSSNQVGDRIFWSRHVKCREWAEKYIETEGGAMDRTTFIEAIRQVYETANREGYAYGDSHGNPPTSDKVISCDRLIAKALWDLGYTDQPVSTKTTSGMTIFNMDSYLQKKGWSKSTKLSDIGYGSVVLTKDANGKPVHTFATVSPMKNGMIVKFDMGSKTRIDSSQPFFEKWNGEGFMAVYNLPGKVETEEPKPVVNENSKSSLVKIGQKALNDYFKLGVEVDGAYGPKSKLAFVKFIQIALNTSFKAGLLVDGILGPKTRQKLHAYPKRFKDRDMLVTALEIGLYLNGYDAGGIENPGIFGNGLLAAVLNFQEDRNLEKDGVAGAATFTALSK